MDLGTLIGAGIPSLIVLVILVWYIVWRIQEKSHPFNAYTTSYEAINGMNLSGKVAIVTGANSGIGKETAKVLAKQGCIVIMACRSQNKGEKAVNDIIKELSHSYESGDSNKSGLISADSHTESTIKQRLILMRLDLSNLESVLLFCKEFIETKLLSKDNNINQIDYLINNAGIMALPEYHESTQGYEMQFATNHLGHWYLVELLLPYLKLNHSRIINLSSYGQYHAKPFNKIYNLFDYCENNQNFMGNKKNEYDDFYNYGISKLCNLLHARRIQYKYNETDGIIAVSVHPGTIQTNLSTEMNMASFFKFWRMLLNPQYYMEEIKTISQGAATTLRCVSMREDEIKGGHWYFNCRSADDRNRLFETAKADKEIHNNKLADKLHTLSKVLVEAKELPLTLDAASGNDRGDNGDNGDSGYAQSPQQEQQDV